MTNAKSQSAGKGTQKDPAVTASEATENGAAGTAEATATATKPDSQPNPLKPGLTETAKDVIALAIKAKPKAGFWRCGVFWPSTEVHAFVVDDPEDALAENDGVGLFIDEATFQRLQAEPKLIVTELEATAELKPDQEPDKE